MKRILLIILFLILLTAGGVGYWKSGLSGRESAMSHQPLMSEYLQVPPLVVPIIEEGVVVEQIQLQVELELAGKEAVRIAKKKRPRLVDAMLAQLHGLMSYRRIREDDNELPFLKKRLRIAVEDSFEEGQLRDVLVRDVSRRPLGTGILD